MWMQLKKSEYYKSSNQAKVTKSIASLQNLNKTSAAACHSMFA